MAGLSEKPTGLSKKGVLASLLSCCSEGPKRSPTDPERDVEYRAVQPRTRPSSRLTRSSASTSTRTPTRIAHSRYDDSNDLDKAYIYTQPPPSYVSAMNGAWGFTNSLAPGAIPCADTFEKDLRALMVDEKCLVAITTQPNVEVHAGPEPGPRSTARPDLFPEAEGRNVLEAEDASSSQREGEQHQGHVPPTQRWSHVQRDFFVATGRPHSSSSHSASFRTSIISIPSTRLTDLTASHTGATERTRWSLYGYDSDHERAPPPSYCERGSPQSASRTSSCRERGNRTGGGLGSGRTSGESSRP